VTIAPPADGFFERADLIRRVRQSLDIAGRALDAALQNGSGYGPAEVSADAEKIFAKVRALEVPKVVAEVAMLLRCAAPLRLSEEAVASAVDDLARRLTVPARGPELLVTLCLEPASAMEHAAAHIHLTDLGHRDEVVDQMLDAVLRGEAISAPERLPNHRLEHDWLRAIWLQDDRKPSGDLLASSCLASPLDALGSRTQDLYFFTHVVLYATDMGRRFCPLPRSPDDILHDAETALAAAVDADNLDLAAELLWTWPMLGVPFSPAATFVFNLLAAAQDASGFLPGPGYTADACAGLPGRLQEEYVLRTSYHATLAMGLLCAAVLLTNTLPPDDVRPTGESDSVIDRVLALLRDRRREPGWMSAFCRLSEERRGALTEFLIAIMLRRARAARDLERLRAGLEIALSCDRVDGPAVRQASALLRRAAILAQTG
jgi:hypothetical protein